MIRKKSEQMNLTSNIIKMHVLKYNAHDLSSASAIMSYSKY